MSTEAMKLALEALELVNLEFVCANGSHHAKKDRHEWDEDCPITDRWRKAITALREALAKQPAQPEPVFTYDQVKAHIQAAMMSAAQRTWVGLTDDELADFWFKQSLDWMEFARVIEDALRSKNT